MMMMKSMAPRALAIGLAAASLLTVASPAFSQSFEIGPNGVRVLQPRDQIDNRGEQIEDRRDRRDRREISEREAVRIARGEGVRNVDDIRRTRVAYRILGSDRRGRDIRVDVDRSTGEVISVR